MNVQYRRLIVNIVNCRLFFKVRRNVRDIPATLYLEGSPASFCASWKQVLPAVSGPIGDPECRRANYFNYY